MASSYNGYPASTDPAAIGIDQTFAVCGVTFPGGVKSGDVATVLAYVIAQFHDRVEPLVSGWCWGYEYRANTSNPDELSNHSSGTCVDVNAPLHGRGGAMYEGFSDAQAAEVWAILAEVNNVIRWGAEFATPDPMHFEINASPTEVAAAAAGLPHGQEEDMGLTEDDKAWIENALRSHLDDFFRRDKLIVTNDRAVTPNQFPYSYETALERIIRLTSATFVGESGTPH